MSLSSARIVKLPTAAAAPVKQASRRGPLPSSVSSFCDALQKRAEFLKEIEFLTNGARIAEDTAARMRREAEALRGRVMMRGVAV